MTSESLQTIEKKKHIVNCAVGLMDEFGFKNVTVQGICKAANISVGSFYHYFSSKDSIVQEMYHLMDLEFVQRREEFLSASSMKDSVKAFVACFATYIVNWGAPVNLLIVRNSLINPNEENTNRLFYDILIQIVEKGQAKGHITSHISTERLCEMIFTQMRGHSYAWAKNWDYPVESEMNTQIGLFVDSI